MKDSTQIGTNRTGMQMSPVHSKALMEIVELDEGTDGAFESNTLAEVRRDYIAEADDVGSIPAPGTLKGMVKSGAKMLTGNRPQMFIDKLAERLAFERGGTRLYDALLSKFLAHEDTLGVSIEELRRFREEEAAHANLVAECIEQLGADPTAQTPSADLVGVETMGLLQAISDPRTSLAHSLHVAQSAELVDRAGWEVLIALAENIGQADMATRFRSALAEEQVHLDSVSQWYQNLIMERSELM